MNHFDKKKQKQAESEPNRVKQVQTLKKTIELLSL